MTTDPTPSPDVRELAIEAAARWLSSYPIPANGIAFGDEADRTGKVWAPFLADAVLAAVSPVIRRQVVEEIAQHLDADADDEAARPGMRDYGSKLIEEWLREAAAIARTHAHPEEKP